MSSFPSVCTRMVLIMLGIAIIGTGAISDSHIKGYLKFPERCKIAALVDINPDKAGKKAAEYGLDVDIYDNHMEALQAPGYRYGLYSACRLSFMRRSQLKACRRENTYWWKSQWRPLYKNVMT